MVKYGYFFKLRKSASAIFVYSHLLEGRAHHKYSVADLHLKPFKLNSVYLFRSKTFSCNNFLSLVVFPRALTIILHAFASSASPVRTKRRKEKRKRKNKEKKKNERIKRMEHLEFCEMV